MGKSNIKKSYHMLDSVPRLSLSEKTVSCFARRFKFAASIDAKITRSSDRSICIIHHVDWLVVYLSLDYNENRG